MTKYWVALIPAALILPGCAAADDRERSLARCERTLARNASPDVAAKACNCIVDGLAAEGLTILGAVNDERGKAIVRSCGRDAGLPVAS
ncbi:hypothetical protein [Sphingomicrobium lutaoense]|uniref:Uncharacterized protein n=1 Tax=Sphingomicrobium lutaoense TaxID=515949 RepID=A0A839Z532_9SPHN|nr:hypothetical protein [Sphingomicrobium lutaoense]MBB3764722.1 hypothetical protein [Sphingomicrobium lutaoense]